MDIYFYVELIVKVIKKIHFFPCKGNIVIIDNIKRVDFKVSLLHNLPSNMRKAVV